MREFFYAMTNLHRTQAAIGVSVLKRWVLSWVWTGRLSIGAARPGHVASGMSSVRVRRGRALRINFLLEPETIRTRSVSCRFGEGRPTCSFRVD